MYLTKNNIIYLPDIKEEQMDYEQIVQDLDLQNENVCDVPQFQGTRKRMRLHQLTWEEKIQRKKLRNRIAAQTSRDRKKAKMDYLEETVKDLKQQNEFLFTQVKELKKQNGLLTDANRDLQRALAERSYTCSCIKVEGEDKRQSSQKVNVVVEQICVRDDHSSERPAESSIPQQKGPWPTVAQMLTISSLGLWKILFLYLLSQKCWKISRKSHSWMTLKDWQQVCWRKLNSKSQEKMVNMHSLRLQKAFKQNAPTTILKWWGRHQKCWNPVEVK